jgi:glycosyltransferase involved in cell wall biosynthesis
LDLPLGVWRRHKLAGLIGEMKPDLIHCWMRRAASLVPCGLPMPVIGWFGGFYEPENFTHCSHFVGVTQGIVTHMIAHGVREDRAHYVQTFPNLDSAPAIDRADLATPADATVLLTLSRLHQKKGLDILLNALVDLPNCVAWLAGDGPLESELKSLSGRLGVADRVRFGEWIVAPCCGLRIFACCLRAGSHSGR